MNSCFHSCLQLFSFWGVTGLYSTERNLFCYLCIEPNRMLPLGERFVNLYCRVYIYGEKFRKIEYVGSCDLGLEPFYF